MNSYNTIINELITQKQFLDEKGFTVNTANTYPSPSEITQAIKNIDFDLSESDATEADVLAGKTFYSKTKELKTGTLAVASNEEINNYLACIISGKGQTSIITLAALALYLFGLSSLLCGNLLLENGSKLYSCNCSTCNSSESYNNSKNLHVKYLLLNFAIIAFAVFIIINYFPIVKSFWSYFLKLSLIHSDNS